MRTEWQVPFIARNFTFKKEVKYRGHIDTPEESTPPDEKFRKFEVRFRIVPNKDQVMAGSEQRGYFYLEIPFNYEESQKVFHNITHNIVQRISFEYGNFELFGGFICCKLIPETEEEEQDIGENMYNVQMRLEEVTGDSQFDAAKFQNSQIVHADISLLAQFNHAKNAKHPIDKFLSFFKILEFQNPKKNKKVGIATVLKANNSLISIFCEIFGIKEDPQKKDIFNEFIDNIVEARHQCAHLKADNNFGYSPIDSRISDEVLPYLSQLEMLTRETVKRM